MVCVPQPSASTPSAMEADRGFKAALEEAHKGSDEGGVPIGAALVSADGRVLGRGHNMRIQKGSATLHVGCARHALVSACPNRENR
jgi:tRNA(Arg) A34 adenosine deaminase TadA